MTPADTDPHATPLTAFVAGTGAHKIAAALLDSDDWMSRSDLADIGRVKRTAVSRVVRVLRFECGVDVRLRRTTDRGEAQYRIGEEREQRPPLHLAA